MTPDERAVPPGDNPPVTGQELSPEQLESLQNETTQADYRRAYLEQIRCQSCPGCGDDGPPMVPWHSSPANAPDRRRTRRLPSDNCASTAAKTRLPILTIPASSLYVPAISPSAHRSRAAGFSCVTSRDSLGTQELNPRSVSARIPLVDPPEAFCGERE